MWCHRLVESENSLIKQPQVLVVAETDLTLGFVVFQSRSVSPLPTTSTRLWRKIPTVSTFSPSTPTPRICLKLSEMASCSGKAVFFRRCLSRSGSALRCFPHAHCFSKLINLSVPDTIDERTINKKKLTPFTKQVSWFPFTS